MLIWIQRGWLLCIGAFLCVFIWREHMAFGEQLAASDLMLVLTVIASILIAKLVCMDLAYTSLLLLGQNCRYVDAAFWYSTADIGKYLPGGIWPIVGRLAMYRAHFSNAISARAFIVETTILIGIPLTIGTAMAFGSYGPLSAIAVVCSSGLILAYCIFKAPRIESQSYGMTRNQRLVLVTRCIAGQLVCWLILFPGGLYLLLEGLEFFSIVAAFDLAFSLGQLAIFAPSGVGVREWVFDYLLRDHSGGFLIAILIFHRALWFLADIIFYLTVLRIRKPSVTSRQ